MRSAPCLFWSLPNSPGVICAFSATSTNKPHAFAFWKLPLADGFLTMLFRSGLSSEAVCIERADMKLAPWFRVARVCDGVCSVFISRRPRGKSRKKSIPTFGVLLGSFEVVSFSGGQCSGSHVVFNSVSRCKAFEAAWIFDKNSKVEKVPHLGSL